MSGLFDSGREGYLGNSLAWDSDDVRAILVDAADYPAKDLAVDNALDDIPAPARVAVSASLGSKTITAGVADAADITFSAVSGDPCEDIVLYKHTGVEATSLLIADIDTATGLPVTPNGGDIGVTWDNGANKIFKL